ncbi:hypothetical protein KSS87_010287 [Heliosperma pusillum]|nr:hypothetical protein KSS87_010287 [Heliosperma pusillum]
MRTRRGYCYPKLLNSDTDTATTSTGLSSSNVNNNRGFVNNDGSVNCPILSTKIRSFDSYCYQSNEKLDSTSRKKAKVLPELSTVETPDFFDDLPDDLVLCILTRVSSSSTSPSDFINVLFTCKRFNELALNSIVLSKASPKTFGIKADKWCDSAHKFLKLCSDSGNADASYTLGMIRFYCLQNRGSGASLMAKAAINSHAHALYSLAVIQFNGSGGEKTDKDLRAGVALCARAAFLGHVDAIRELGHCLQDGYGVRQNVIEGRRFLVQANARELAASLTSSQNCSRKSCDYNTDMVCLPLLSDFGCDVPGQEVHPVSRFMAEWYSGRVIEDGLRTCGHTGCGRPETRKHEFRRCSVCGRVGYCSRACQAMDWKVGHKLECGCLPRHVDDGGVGGDVVNVGGDGETVGMEVDDGES